MVRVTRMLEGDGGMEIRVEIELAGQTHEIVVCDGMFGHTVELFTNGKLAASD